MAAQGGSRGGLSTNRQAAVDALGNPLGSILTPGHASECAWAKAMMAGFAVHAVLAGQGYDANALIATMQSNAAIAVMPARKNRLE